MEQHHPFSLWSHISPVILYNKQYSLTYPRTVPTLDLADRKGISEKDGVELLEALTKKAAELVGEVMIYELVLTAGK